MGMTGINNPGFAPRDKSPTTLDRVFQGLELATKILGTGVDAYTGLKNAKTASETSETNKFKSAVDFATNLRPAITDEEKVRGVSIPGVEKQYPGLAGKVFVPAEKPESDVAKLAKALAGKNAETTGKKNELDLKKAQDEATYGKPLNTAIGAVERLGDYGAAMKIAENVQAKMDKMEKLPVGVYESKGGMRPESVFPYSPEDSRWRADVGKVTAAYRKRVTGTGASDSEKAELLKAAADVNFDPPEVFKAKWGGMVDFLKNDQNSFLDALKKSGYDVRQFEQPTQNKPPEEFEKDVLEYAKMHNISPSEAKKAKEILTRNK